MKIWTQKYTVWNSIIDIQHKSLFDLAKEIYFIKNNHVSINEVRMLSIEFLKQLKDHAKYEEKYMKRIAYPYIDIHMKEHKKIMSSLASLVKNTSNINEFKTKFSDFIDDNIIKHILEEDIKYANFKKKRICFLYLWMLK